MKTIVVNEKKIDRAWYVVDATDVALGRLASRIAQLLIGKGKPSYSPNQDHGDNIVVVNCEKVNLTGRKPITKEYFRHSTYPGGGKTRTYKEQMSLDPAWIIKHAVKGMVPKTTLGRAMMKKLHVYKGDTHPHVAQNPQPLNLGAR